MSRAVLPGGVWSCPTCGVAVTASDLNAESFATEIVRCQQAVLDHRQEEHNHEA